MHIMEKIYTSQNGTKAEVKKHGKNVYSLTIISRNIGRNRWGTQKEILSDIEYFLASDTLPMSKSPRMF